MLNQPVFYSHHCLGWLQEEIIHIQQWAKNNNLKLNTSKSKEMLFRAHGVHGKSAHLPPTSMDIERVATHTMLGVVVNDRLTATDHVNHLLSSAAILLYTLRILHSHGTPTQSLYDIFCATVIAKLTYCSPAWAGSLQSVRALTLF